jgi:hypothetical protein
MLLARPCAGLSFVAECVVWGVDFHRLQNLKAEPELSGLIFPWLP